MHAWFREKKKQVEMKLVGSILILYDDGDHRSFMIIFRFWKILGVYIFSGDFVFRV